MRVLLTSIVLVGALACSESSAPDPRGSVSFTYTGAGGGTFSAAGDVPSFAGPPPATSWTFGFVEQGETHVAGSVPRAGGLVDLAIVRFERTSPGTESIDPSCNIDGNVSCTGMEMYLNFNGDGDTGDYFCALTSGTIVVTEAGSRAKGSFSGNGVCIAGDGGSSTAFSVSNGAFDVLLVAPPT